MAGYLAPVTRFLRFEPPNVLALSDSLASRANVTAQNQTSSPAFMSASQLITSMIAANNNTNGPGNTDPGDLSYGYLSFLTLQAVAQTIIICLFGYFAARTKLLTPAVQKQVSALNVQIFTPCLIFSKLASSLSLSALVDIAIIPVLFVITTGISMMCARICSRILRFDRHESNFVTAMAVFGNSNSLPVSLTVSLAYTLPTLMWPDLPNDNQDDVASRGILYLLIFQQLGQIVRWSWGYNTLLARPALERSSSHASNEPITYIAEGQSSDEESIIGISRKKGGSDSGFSSPHDPLLGDQNDGRGASGSGSGSANSSSGNSADEGDSDSNDLDNAIDQIVHTPSGPELRRQLRSLSASTEHTLSEFVHPSEEPRLHQIKRLIINLYHDIMAFMNPPLWSMLTAILVASIPAAKHELFGTDGFVNHTVASAINQLGGIAIPLILVVLGSNLAPNETSAPASRNHNKIVFASLLSRMIMPSVFLLPIIALSVKYIQLSILDDPIFLLVAFILTVSPPAIQLSQICQLNEVYEKEMAAVLFWGYVVLTLPSTIAIVVASLKVLDWAGVTRS